MKSTDIERQKREQKRMEKKQEYLERKQREERSVGDFINDLHDLFYFDKEKIYNINMSEEILELLEEMKITAQEKQWDNILRKAVKKTKVKEKDAALKELKALADID